MTALAQFTLPKGTIITCPHPYCRQIIAVTTRDLKPLDSIRSNLFDFSRGQGPRDDKKATCKMCNSHWFVDIPSLTRVHTARGWFPPEENLVDGMRRAKAV